MKLNEISGAIAYEQLHEYEKLSQRRGDAEYA